MPKIVLKYEAVNAEKLKKNKWTNSAGQEELPGGICETRGKRTLEKVGNVN